MFESANFVAPTLVGDELRVGLPKGETFDVKLSSSLVASRVGHMSIARFGSPSLQARFIQGEHWATTPSRNLRLVHAVRQPLRPTEFVNLLETRRRGQTNIQLEDTMATSRKSTERVEVYAEWVEKTDFLPVGVDELHEPERWEPEREVPVDSKVFERSIDLQGPDGSLPIDVRHELHTTRHIPAISYRTVATTRFKEYFTERAEVSPPSTSPGASLPSTYSGPAAAGSQAIVEDSERVTSLDGTQTFERLKPGEPESEGYYTMDYEAGTISRFDLGGRDNMPDEVRVTYIKREITRPSPGPTVKRALSTRRPDPPKIQYAMPTFKRTADSIGNITRASREVAGLRVFLDRPWWSSGDEELLGVVIADGISSSGVEHLVSRAGQDPIWKGSSVRELLYGINFPAAIESQGGLTLPEAPSSRTFTVAGHAVRPDIEHLRWYCDIDISPGDAYTPFVRLALARYQPNSLIGLELSPVVQLDYMQLYPNRFAYVFRQNSSSVSVNVDGIAHDGGRYRRTPGATTPPGSAIEVQLEQRRDDMPLTDELFGWVPVPGEPPVRLEFREDSKGGPVGSWSGDINAPTGGRYRIAIREYEQFGPKVGIGTGRFQRRLVYAEAIDVPGDGIDP